MTEIVHRNLDIAGSSLSIIESGNGPAVLLGHGYLWDWQMWRPQINALSARYRLVVPEMWGHGSSGGLPPDTERTADLAGQMLALMDRLEIATFAVIGSSMGGMWAAHLAAMVPERVTALVLMNSSLGKEPDASRQAYFAMLDQVEREGRVSEEILSALVPLFFDVTECAPDLPSLLRNQVVRFDAESLRRSIVPLGRLIFGREHALDILAQLDMPGLVVAGERDRSRPAEESAAMAEIFRAEFHVIEDCGHTATLEQATAVSRILGRFLEGVNW